ncbi:MAG: hypothetical protein MR606_05145 [Mollicutes bacterium]|nr:hypothetical protein [Mollicutes bacterium]MDD7263695.1 hypothetical protein [bacterium]MDY4979458.1 hypothetical protein [Candidatus Onthovivens sp.]
MANIYKINKENNNNYKDNNDNNKGLKIFIIIILNIILIIFILSYLFLLIIFNKDNKNKVSNKEVEDYISNFSIEKLENNINYLSYKSIEYDIDNKIDITYDIKDINNLYYYLEINDNLISKLYIDKDNNINLINLDEYKELNNIEIYNQLKIEINTLIKDIFYYQNKVDLIKDHYFNISNNYLYIIDNINNNDFIKINKYGLIEEINIKNKVNLLATYKYINI